ncbi:hypothetical protein LUZ63_005343 [Rhynchospora breviuscula]|uniref:Trimethylguanosine synthase n=1 Tax=Rhynchospora breviuscula TaxID=2022672 RepID=A0A9Q0CMR8_9POAL|nr:hypothetical protein LUZ63_005343 [Rhynchospora breviuscula]
MATGAAIGKLGDLFKLTEVHLWDNANLYCGFQDRGTHIPFDEEPTSPSAATGLISTSAVVTEPEEVPLNSEEDIELAQQMDALGLPLTFTSSKKNITVNGRKKKGTIVKSQSAPSKVGDSNSNEITRSDIHRELEDSCNSSSGIFECNAQFEYGDWRVQWDDFYKRDYFYNVQSHESTWDPPSGLENYNILPENVDEKDVSENGFCVEASCSKLSPPEQSIEESALPDIGEVYDDILHKGSRNDTDNGIEYHSKPTKRKKKKRVRKSHSQQMLLDAPGGSLLADIGKYWNQRYTLFSRFDSGIEMDEEGWFSVTPEAIAKHHASRCSTGTIVDCFTGVGGNAIQFAMRSDHVIAIDIDPQKIAYARNNAAIYGVDGLIDFVVGDSIQITPNLRGRTVFMSPPWGGPDYAKAEMYDIQTMLKPRDGHILFELGMKIASRVVMFLPRNTDLNQLAELALSVDPPWSLEVEKNFLNGKLKAITAYFEKRNVICEI